MQDLDAQRSSPCEIGNDAIQSQYDNANALQKSGRLEEAIREFSLLAAEVSDANWKAALLLSEVWCYAHSGRLDDADRVLEEIGKLAPIDSIKMDAAYVMACISAQRGDRKKAAFQYGNVLQEYAQLLATAENRDFYRNICYQRATELASLGEYSEAVPLFEEAALSASLKAEDQQELHSWLGVCYESLHENDLAIREFLQVIAFNLINGKEAETRYRIARLYFDRGMRGHPLFGFLCIPGPDLCGNRRLG
jgi:tetratricopeptide (TPR) repeat protein